MKPLTCGQAARLCGVAPRTIAKWVDSGALPGYRMPLGKDRRILPADLLAFGKKHRLPESILEGIHKCL